MEEQDEYVMNEEFINTYIGRQLPARYTEVLDNLLNYSESRSAIERAMSTYPLYQTDPNRIKQYGTAYQIPTRAELNTKILNFYRFREIGQETFGRWLFELETALNEIMPKYNQLFYSADQDFNPIYNVDYVKTIDRSKDDSTVGTQNSSSNTSTTGSDTTSNEEYTKTVNAKTPQDSLNISNTGIDSVEYADDASWGKSSGSTTGSNTTTGNTSSNGSNSVIGKEKEGTVETTKGNFGVVSAQDLIIKYRETILNIEQLIINDPRIAELFMLIY
jgi:hypothetical protein